MRVKFPTRTWLWLGSILLLALAVVVPVAPAMALPVVFDLSGPLTGVVAIDEALTEPFVTWHYTDGSSTWDNSNDFLIWNRNVFGPGIPDLFSCAGGPSRL